MNNWSLQSKAVVSIAHVIGGPHQDFLSNMDRKPYLLSSENPKTKTNAFQFTYTTLHQQTQSRNWACHINYQEQNRVQELQNVAVKTFQWKLLIYSSSKNGWTIQCKTYIANKVITC